MREQFATYEISAKLKELGFDPKLYFGGDNVAFWGPLAWSIIFGLSFATFLTLMFVPALYELDYTIKLKMKKRKNLKRIKELNK